MIRQAVFGLLLGMAYPVFAQESSIPLSRLVADAVVPVPLDPGAGASTAAVWIPSPSAGTVTAVNVKDN